MMIRGNVGCVKSPYHLKTDKGWLEILRPKINGWLIIGIQIILKTQKLEQKLVC